MLLSGGLQSACRVRTLWATRQQHTTAVTAPLKLEPNLFFEWQYEEAGVLMQKETQTRLRVFTVCSGVLRRPRSTAELLHVLPGDANETACQTYKDFNVPSFMPWMDDHGRKTPQLGRNC